MAVRTGAEHNGDVSIMAEETTDGQT